jgi:hypothetical protein
MNLPEWVVFAGLLCLALLVVLLAIYAVAWGEQ